MLNTSDIDLIRTRWNEGASTGVIAKELGVTRGAVAGKLQRAGLFKSRPQIPPKTAQHETTRSKPRRATKSNIVGSWTMTAPQDRKPPRPERASESATESALISIADLKAHHCRWPMWTRDDEPRLFCGADRFAPNCSYCLTHFRMSRGRQ